MVAFTSQSSVGTIPVTIKQLVSDLGVNEDIASFIAALGANLGMPACAGIWPMLLAVLAINIFDIPYSLGQYVFLIVLTLIVSIGTVGVPGTSTVTTIAIFTAVGLPVEIIVLLVPISSIVDMMRTATNVTGAATAAILVAKSEQLLDCEIYRVVSENSLKMQQKNRPYKRIQQVGEKNVHFKIVQGNFPEKRA